jgi:hypothetical protein
MPTTDYIENKLITIFFLQKYTFNITLFREDAFFQEIFGFRQPVFNNTLEKE